MFFTSSSHVELYSSSKIQIKVPSYVKYLPQSRKILGASKTCVYVSVVYLWSNIEMCSLYFCCFPRGYDSLKLEAMYYLILSAMTRKCLTQSQAKSVVQDCMKGTLMSSGMRKEMLTDKRWILIRVIKRVDICNQMYKCNGMNS